MLTVKLTVKLAAMLTLKLAAMLTVKVEQCDEGCFGGTEANEAG